MPDLPPSGSGHLPHFADRIVREVVVQVEFLAVVGSAYIVIFLHILWAAERCDHKRLRLSALEEAASVNHRQNPDLCGKRTDIRDPAAVHTHMLVENRGTDRLLNAFVESHLHDEFEILSEALFEFRLEIFQHLGQHHIQRLAAFFLARQERRALQRCAAGLFDRIHHILRNEMQFRSLFGPSAVCRKLSLRGALEFNDVVGKIHRIGEKLFGALLRFAFDHDDLIFLAGVDQFDFAFLHLFDGRIGDELPVDVSDADRTDRSLERQIGEAERRRCSEHVQRVGIIFPVIGEHESVDLHLVKEPFREERTKRTVGHAHGEDFLVRRPSFAFDESAGEASCRGEFFAVVHLEREEIRPFAGGAGACCRQNAGVAHANHAGAVGEVCEFPGGDFHALSGSQFD